MKQTLIKLFKVNAWVLKENLAGISHDESVRMPEPAGNCLNWTVGHIVSSRNELLKILGAEPLWAEGHGTVYGRGETLRDAADALPLEALLADHEKTGPLLTDAIGAIGDDRWEEALSFEFPGGFKTIGTGIAFMQFHEAYHVGQTGLLRRMAGKDGAIA